MFNYIKPELGKLFHDLADMLIPKWVKDLFTGIIGFFKNPIGSIKVLFGTAVDYIYKGMVEQFGRIVFAIEELKNEFIYGLPEWMGGKGGKTGGVKTSYVRRLFEEAHPEKLSPYAGVSFIEAEMAAMAQKWGIKGGTPLASIQAAQYYKGIKNVLQLPGGTGIHVVQRAAHHGVTSAGSPSKTPGIDYNLSSGLADTEVGISAAENRRIGFTLRGGMIGELKDSKFAGFPVGTLGVIDASDPNNKIFELHAHLDKKRVLESLPLGTMVKPGDILGPMQDPGYGTHNHVSFLKANQISGASEIGRASCRERV
jgi:hypothetical protein